MPKQSKISYEPEADVLTWEINDAAPIDSAKEVGNVVIHFTENNVPVLIEILEATSFLKEAKQLLSDAEGKSPAPAQV